MAEKEWLPGGEAPEEERKENSGEYLWRVLKPAGCIFVLLLMVVFLVFCFTYRNDPLAESVPAETAEASAAIKE